MILYEWDTAKARSNLRKHGLRFENGLRVFDDPWAVSEQDRIVDGELRWQIVGLFEGRSLLTVAYTVREEGTDEIVRIISVRKSGRRERIAYEQNRQENH
jgi:uncharacterized DUF497 family protein